MKKRYYFLAVAALSLLTVQSHAQLGLLAGGLMTGLSSSKSSAPQGPRFGGAMSKLFGENTSFTAKIEMAIQEPGKAQPITMPGKMSFLEGKTRFEMDLTEAKGTGLPEAAATQVKALGMGEIVMISRPDKKLAYVVYPGMEAFMENPLSDEEAPGPNAKYQVDETELGKEIINGKDCVKNKVVVTDEKGTKHEALVWNSTDLKKFPMRMQYAEDGRNAIITFREIDFTKPNLNAFTPKEGYARYTSMGDFMRGLMMKQFGGGAAPAK